MPQRDRLATVPGGQDRTIRRPGNAVDRVVQLRERCGHCAGVRVPDPDRRVGGARGEVRPVRGKGERGDDTVMAAHRA